VLLILKLLYENYLKIMQKWLWGYNEIRNLYKRSGIFNDTTTEERNIHWIRLMDKAGARLQL
jgi:hypothetical protein